MRASYSIKGGAYLGRLDEDGCFLGMTGFSLGEGISAATFTMWRESFSRVLVMTIARRSAISVWWVKERRS